MSLKQQTVGRRPLTFWCLTSWTILIDRQCVKQDLHQWVITCGVPQGSALEPLPFTPYIMQQGKLSDDMTWALTLYMYKIKTGWNLKVSLWLSYLWSSLVFIKLRVMLKWGCFKTMEILVSFWLVPLTSYWLLLLKVLYFCSSIEAVAY